MKKTFNQFLNEAGETDLRFFAHLRDSSDVELGWHWEEGGCWGMALAIFDHLTELGFQPKICVSSGFVHAFVELNGKFYDWEGEIKASKPYQHVSREELIKRANDGGADMDTIEADAAEAKATIERACRAVYRARSGANLGLRSVKAKHPLKATVLECVIDDSDAVALACVKRDIDAIEKATTPTV